MLRVELDWPIAVYRHSVLSLLVFLLPVVSLLGSLPLACCMGIAVLSHGDRGPELDPWALAGKHGTAQWGLYIKC